MKVLIAGDFAPSARLAHQIEEERYSDIFPDNLRTIIKSADFSFVNFESPVVDSGCQPILKCGPNLKCSTNAAKAVSYAGFTGVTMANNHIFDYGPEGLKHSVECCKNLGLNVVGVGDNLMEANNVLYLKKNGKTLAIINCCEHEFSIATETSPGANPLNPINQYYAIQKAKAKADYILVIVHGGHEHFQLPSLRMQQTYRFFVDAGADAVVNHHQHCYSGYEVYNGKPIFYGIGNFCFDANDSCRKLWNRGLLVTIDFNNAITFAIRPYIQNEEQLGVYLCERESDEYLSIMKDIERLSQVIVSPSDLDRAFDSFEDSTKTFYKKALEPYSNYYTRALFEKGFLPSFLSKEKKMLLYNIIACESHRERLIRSLSEDIK